MIPAITNHRLKASHARDYPELRDGRANHKVYSICYHQGSELKISATPSMQENQNKVSASQASLISGMCDIWKVIPAESLIAVTMAFLNRSS